MANAGGRQNGPSMSLAAAMDGQGLRSGQQADDWAYRRGGDDVVGRGGTGGGGYDAPGVRQYLGEVAVARGRMAQA